MEAAVWEEFRRRIPSPVEGGESVDWVRLSQSWGKQFPSDYREFMEVYGPGGIQNVLGALEPKGKAEYCLFDGSIAYETLNAEEMWKDVPKSSELDGIHPELIAWGVDDGGGIYCWDSSGRDPDTWPVLVYSRSYVVWRKYDCGMVEFLLRVMRADFDENPLSIGELWGVESAAFQSLREELRMYEEDPLYAGIPYDADISGAGVEGAADPAVNHQRS